MTLQKYTTTPLSAPFMKRNDIYGLRAFVIVPMLIHNLNETILPYASLGLDIFFVTSGYFIAMILNKNERISYMSFLYKRLRQLLPVHFTVIALTLIFSIFCADSKNRNQLLGETRSALFLYSNVKNLSEYLKNGEVLKTQHFFSHIWLLCVEIQFCFIVPLISKYLMSEKISHKKIVIGVGISSCLAQLFASSIFAQEFTPLHFYSFMIGMIAFYWNNDCKQNLPLNSEEKTQWIKKNASNFGPLQNFDYIVTPICLFMILLVMVVNESIGLARIRCSVFAFIIIMIGTKQQSILLTNTLIVWIGSHAYTIYLIYWPLIIFWKNLFGPQIELLDGLQITTIILFLGWSIDFIVHKLLMQKMTTKFLSIMTILTLYLFCELLLSYLNLIK